MNNSEKNVSTHYNKMSQRTFDQREKSVTFAVRKLHNWIKSVLISESSLSKNEDCGGIKKVLDLACGSGGDIKKWQSSCSKLLYRGVDISPQSIEEAKRRYDEMMLKKKRKRYNDDAHDCKFYCADMMDVGKIHDIVNDGPYDIISVQFALHYAVNSRDRAEKFASSISSLLKSGGRLIMTFPDACVFNRRRTRFGEEFGNPYYRVNDIKLNDEEGKQIVSYHFTMPECVENCKEYVVPKTILEDAFGSTGSFDQPSYCNFRDYIQEKWKPHSDLRSRMGIHSSMIHDQSLWDCTGFYTVFTIAKN